MGHIKLIKLIDVFAKLGVLFWDSESKLTGFSSIDNSGNAFAWGLGAGVSLGPLGVRLEFENFHVEDPQSLSSVMLGATFGF